MTDCLPAHFEPCAAAAEWWAQQLANPTFRNATDGEIAQGGDDYLAAGVMATMLAERHAPSTEALERFKVALIGLLMGRSGQLWRPPEKWADALHVDYGPDLVLFLAADLAGISTSRFPWKSHMWITRDRVDASLGHGAPTEVIWARPGVEQRLEPEP